LYGPAFDKFLPEIYGRICRCCRYTGNKDAMHGLLRSGCEGGVHPIQIAGRKKAKTFSQGRAGLKLDGLTQV
jgi:hypothetical protein